ncbi:unnamed protein product [Auanema sp. JU1783]|nr:unnamed protein product [Auanema sp. JU1783]
MGTAQFSLGGWVEHALCPYSLATAINVYFIILIQISSFLFATLFYVHIKISNHFHPFFSILLGSIIFSYALCGLCLSVQRIVFLFEWDTLHNLLEYPIVYLYGYITPAYLSFIIERLIATIYYSRYEHSRFWPLLVVLVVFANCFAIFEITQISKNEEGGEKSYVFGYYLMGLCALTSLAFLIIFLINQYLMKSSTNHMTLTQRYQLIENIKVVRNALLPIAIFDTLITVTDFAGNAIFKEKFIPIPDRCENAVVYIVVFTLMNTLSICFEYCIPLFIMLKWAAYKKNLPFWINCRKQVVPHRDSTVILSVFGDSLNQSPTVIDYFNHLQMEWNK